MKSISMRVEGKTISEYIIAIKHNYRFGKVHSVKNDNKNFKNTNGNINIFDSRKDYQDLDLEKEFYLTRNKLNVKIKLKNIDAKNFTMEELNILSEQCKSILESQYINFFIKQKLMYEIQKAEYIKNKNIKDSKIEEIKNTDKYIQLSKDKKLQEEYLKEEIKKLNVSLRYPRWERLTAPIFEGLVAFGNIYDLDLPKERREELTKEFNNLMIGEDQKPSELMKKINSQVMKNLEKLEQELNIQINKNSITWHLDEDGLIHAHYLGDNFNQDTGQPIATPKKSDKATNKNTVSKQVGELMQDIISDNMEELGFERGVKGGKFGRTTNISILEYKQECKRLDALRENTEKDIVEEISIKMFELKNLKQDIEYQESQKVDIKTLQRTRDNYDALLKDIQELEEEKINLNTFIQNNSKKQEELERIDNIVARKTQEEKDLIESIAERKKELESVQNDLKNYDVVLIKAEYSTLKEREQFLIAQNTILENDYNTLTDNVFYKKEELEKYQGNVEYFEKLDKALEDDILDIREIEELIEATKDSKIINKLFKNVKKIITKNKDISDKIAKSEVSERALKTNLNYISNKLDQLLGEFPLLRGEMEQLNDKYNVDYDPNDFNINDNVEDMELKDLEKLYTARFSMLEILIETIVRKNLLTTEQEEKIISISKKRDADK